jgi:hypothetical protein
MFFGYHIQLPVLFAQPIHYVLMTHHIYAIMGVPAVVLFVSAVRIAARQLAER